MDMLEKVYAKAGDSVRAGGASKYMRNQFEYFGIQTDERRRIGKKFLDEHGYPLGKELESLIRKLWTNPQREFQYFGMELLEQCVKKKCEIRIGLIEYMIQHKSWWDTVDFIAPKLAGQMMKNEKQKVEETALRWIKSENMWLKRSAILIQLKYKKETNQKLLFNLILKAAGEKDFFIRKAIGWSLREYAKTNPEGVRDFVHDNEQKLSGLSKREALKNIG